MRAADTSSQTNVEDGPRGMPHLAGSGALLRQRMAVHFVDGLDHIVEIGGHLSPVSQFLTHIPASFTCIDPKAEPLQRDTLRGQRCTVRHIDRKFQDVPLELEPGSYGLVMVGYSLKPFGKRDPVGEQLFALMRHSVVTVIEFALALERASSQIEQILERSGMRVETTVSFTISDGVMDRSAYGQRQLHVLRPGRG